MMNPAVTQVLLEAALRALMIALVLWLGMRLLRVSNALVQKAAWTMVLGAAVAMPFVVHWQLRPAWAVVSVPAADWSKWLGFAHHAQKPAAAVPVQIDSETVASSALRADDQVPISAEAYTVTADSASATTALAANPVAKSARTIAPAPRAAWSTRIIGWTLSWAWLLYLGVGGALLIRLAYGLGSSARLWLQAQRIESGVEVPPGIEVRWSRRVGSPVNIGSGILLPEDYAQWDREKLRVVLAHESAHIEQRDFYLQMLAGLYAAVIWFSPLGWWLKRKLSELGEAISDKAGLEAAGSPVAYAELLLEFAVRPRPTFAGVAMAHSTNLHQRIERLLNESSFRRVFTGKRRSAVALLLPAVLIAATALVHVQAAAIPSQSSFTQSASQPASPAQPGAARTGQSHPDQEVDGGPGAVPKSAPQESAAPALVPSPAPHAAPVAPVLATPAPGVRLQLEMPSIVRLENMSHRLAIVAPGPKSQLMLKLDGLAALAAIDRIQIVVPTSDEAAQDSRRDTYRIFGDEGHRPHLDGNLNEDCEAAARKARQDLQKPTLFVCHDGKPYVIDDPAAMAQINDIDNQMNDKNEQMRALGKQMRDDSQQAREEARKEREAAEKIPKPDITKEVAELDAAAAALKADEDGNVSREQLQELQRKLSEVQRRLISVEVKVDVNTSVAMSKFGAEQGKFGEQMGKLGSEIGQLAHERDQKIRAIIDESLKNGKAKPVN